MSSPSDHTPNSTSRLEKQNKNGTDQKTQNSGFPWRRGGFATCLKTRVDHTQRVQHRKTFNTKYCVKRIVEEISVGRQSSSTTSSVRCCCVSDLAVPVVPQPQISRWHRYRSASFHRGPLTKKRSDSLTAER